MKSLCGAFLLCASVLALSAPAFAGEPVTGSGPTKSAAADDANRRAAEIAKKKGISGAGGTCYTPAKIEECKKDPDGGFICTAVVANERGSCGK